MALWAFHNNPGIGGFGESTPILFDRTNASKRKKKKRRTEALCSSNCKNRNPNKASDSFTSEQRTVDTTTNNHCMGEADLVCQIVKELVDNAVDACRVHVDDMENEEGNHEKRIRVDIRRFIDNESTDGDSIASGPSKTNTDDILQLTVTDTGCGMENIQSCVNAFQTSKGRNNYYETTNNVSSGRYGIGLTLCLLHAQRCVPYSRACISSATKKSKHVTRSFFEVNKEKDSVKCVQEEIINVPSSQRESGTCVSLLIPGGKAAKLAWPRLCDYFTRFKLCTKLQLQLEVFAPTFSGLPIFIRPRHAKRRESETLCSGNETTPNFIPIGSDDDRWTDPLDSDNSHVQNDSNVKELEIDEKQKSIDCSNREARDQFANAVQSFWPKCNIPYHNVAQSVRNISNANDETNLKQAKSQKSTVQLEVGVAVCPPTDRDQSIETSVGSSDTTSDFLRDERATTLQLIRIVNDVPMIENAEAHSCGLVHGIANKQTWGYFGIDIERSTEANTNFSSPSFTLHDSSLVAPFIHKNPNHRQLDTDESVDECETSRKRHKDKLTDNYLLPVNLRIGKILVVVHVRANPTSLPLPTLSKGRLPLHHVPINEALQLGLRECIENLQASNPTLFLTKFALQTVERDALYVPALASAVSRIVCQSKSRIFQDTIPKEMSVLTEQMEHRLRLALQVRNETRRSKNCKSLAEFDDLDSERSSVSRKKVLGCSISTSRRSLHQQLDEYSFDAFPVREIIIEKDDNEDTFEDFL